MISRAEEYRKRLQMYYDAEEAIVSGSQSYQIGSRNLTRANLADIQKMIDYLIKKVAEAEVAENGKGKMKVMGGVPRDV